MGQQEEISVAIKVPGLLLARREIFRHANPWPGVAIFGLEHQLPLLESSPRG